MVKLFQFGIKHIFILMAPALSCTKHTACLPTFALSDLNQLWRVSPAWTDVPRNLISIHKLACSGLLDVRVLIPEAAHYEKPCDVRRRTEIKKQTQGTSEHMRRKPFYGRHLLLRLPFQNIAVRYLMEHNRAKRGSEEQGEGGKEQERIRQEKKKGKKKGKEGKVRKGKQGTWQSALG